MTVKRKAELFSLILGRTIRQGRRENPDEEGMEASVGPDGSGWMAMYGTCKRLVVRYL
jgi:hypothetical protein